jgi:enoyl-CoA hydratase
MSNTLLTQQDGRVFVLTLNRPEKLNALSVEMRKALHHEFLELDGDDSVGAIILTGAGDRAFTAGMDLTEASERGGEVTPDENPVTAIEKCRKPIIVAVNGLCITGGMEMMLACDIVIAARTAKFADTHVRVGLMRAGAFRNVYLGRSGRSALKKSVYPVIFWMLSEHSTSASSTEWSSREN